MSAWTCCSSDRKAAAKIVPPRLESHDGRALVPISKKHEPASGIDTVAADSLKVLDPKRRLEADVPAAAQNVAMTLSGSSGAPFRCDA